MTGKPERAGAAEAVLVGQPVSEETTAEAAAAVAGDLTNPIGDDYASGEFRVHLATVLAKRAITAAIASVS